MSAGFSNSAAAFDALRQLVRRGRAVERCELCRLALGRDHPHLLEIAQRKLACTCEPCAILFSGVGMKFKRVPRRVLSLANFNLSDEEWNGLTVPINMAFFFRSNLERRVIAMYPSPAGATESLLALEAWNAIEERNSVLRTMETDVEALLVNRLGYSRGYSAAEYYLLPIDECYRLVGLIRMHWKGLSGGTAVWSELGGFFRGLKQRATEYESGEEDAPLEEGSHA